MFILDTVLYWIVYGIIAYLVLFWWGCLLVGILDAWIENITKGDYRRLLSKKLSFIRKPHEVIGDIDETAAIILFGTGACFSGIVSGLSVLFSDKIPPLYEVISIASNWAVENLNVYLYGVIVLVGLHFVFKHGYSFIKRVNTILEKEKKVDKDS